MGNDLKLVNRVYRAAGHWLRTSTASPQVSIPAPPGLDYLSILAAVAAILNDMALADELNDASHERRAEPDD